MPLDSDNYEFTVEHGDVIVLASDGVLDNVYDSEMAKEIGSLQIGVDTPNTEKLQVKQNNFCKYVIKWKLGSSFGVRVLSSTWLTINCYWKIFIQLADNCFL